MNLQSLFLSNLGPGNRRLKLCGRLWNSSERTRQQRIGPTYAIRFDFLHEPEIWNSA